MSVELAELKDPDFDIIAIMAPDYGKKYVWLWQGGEHGYDQRIDMSRSQLTQLARVIDEILT